MKLTINKLIANDMINYGMDKTSSFNYIVSLNSYLEEYDEESQKYIKENLDDIKDDIERNECVADLVVEKNDDDIDFNMVFYWGYLLTQTEKIVYENAKRNNIELDFEDIKDIASEILDDDAFLRIIRKHGSDKILFGTDSPWKDQKDYVERIQTLSLTDNEKRQIFSENAISLLKGTM